jgi:hypothetical protein
VDNLKKDVSEMIDNAMKKQMQGVYQHISLPIKNLMGDFEEIINHKLEVQYD